MLFPVEVSLPYIDFLLADLPAKYGTPETLPPPQRMRSKCFCTPGGNTLRRRSRIALPHIDARERFSRREICAADAFGQRPMSKDISWVVQGIIWEPRQHRGAPTRYARWSRARR